MSKEYGPWTGPEVDGDYARAHMPEEYEVLEVELWHDEKTAAGKGLMVGLRKGPIPRLMQCKVLAAEDQYYSWWLFEDHTSENPALYRFASGKGDDAETSYKRNLVTPIWRWRVLNPRKLSALKWLGKNEQKTMTETLELLLSSECPGDAEAKKKRPRDEAMKDDEDVARALDAEINPGDRPRRQEAGAVELVPKGGRGVADDLATLEREVGGEKLSKVRKPEVEDRERSDVNSGKPNKGRPAEDQEPRRKDDDGAAAGAAAKRRIRFESAGPDKHKKKKDKKDKKKKLKGAKKSKKRRESSSSSDSSDSSSSESLFRVASSSQSRGTQARLIRWAKENPGKLAAKLLQKMQNATGREGEATEFDSYSTPAAAKAYFLRVLEPKAAQAGVRKQREMRMLTTALDHLAQGRSAEAADVLAQRLIAVEVSVQDGGWNRANFLELTQEDDTLAGPELQMLANKEVEGRLRLARPPYPAPSYERRGDSWQRYQEAWKGYKGEGKGKDKNKDKGKGKGKGKKDRWSPAFPPSPGPVTGEER